MESFGSDSPSYKPFAGAYDVPIRGRRRACPATCQCWLRLNKCRKFLCCFVMFAIMIVAIPIIVILSRLGAVCGKTVTADQVNMIDDTLSALRIVKSNGCPGYDWTSQSTPNKARVQNHKFVFPLYPRISKYPFVWVGVMDAAGNKIINTVKGAIGVAVNGVSIYGNSDAQDKDAFVNEGVSFDHCGGHPQNFGDYHYHAEPTEGCVFHNTAGQHSPLFGILADGVPLFGTHGDNGTIPANLDECNGHTDDTYPFYHYHLTGRQYPYTVACLKGCVSKSFSKDFTSVSTCNEGPIKFNYETVSALFRAGLPR